MDELSRQSWDKKNWSLALLTKNPVEFYQEQKKAQEDVSSAEPIDTLPHKDWLRAT